MVHWVKAHYLDASAAVKLVCGEPGAEVIRKYFEDNAVFQITDLCFAEALGVLKAKRFFRGKLSQEQYEKACFLLLSYVDEGQIQIEQVATRPLFFAAREIMRRYGLDLSDALQVLTVKEGPRGTGAGESKTVLVTADDALAVAAESEGLRAWNVLRSSSPPAA